MTLLILLWCLLGRTETLLQLPRDLLELSGMYLLILLLLSRDHLKTFRWIRLHRPAFTVSFTVENSGSVFGGEVGCC